MLSVGGTPTVITAQPYWGYWGRAFRPYWGRTFGAYWGALDAVVGSLTCPYLPLLALITTHYSLLTTPPYPLGFGFSMRSF